MTHAIKGIQSYYTDIRTFSRGSESIFYWQIDDYVNKCANWDALDKDKLSFFKFLLTNSTDTRQYYNAIMSRRKNTRIPHTGSQPKERFERRDASTTKQISSRLKAISIADFSEDDENDYASLDKLTTRKNQLAPIARV